MSRIEDFKSAIDREIALFNYGQNPTELYEPIRYLMGQGGKRLRPMLTLLSASLFTDQWQDALKPAHAVEAFHNFTLMHDDIMDKAPLRRGKPTVHERWDENTAILSGDVMLVKAYELLLGLPAETLAPALRRFSTVAANVCEGQQLDMNFEMSESVTLSEYLEMIRLKTSVLLGFSLELGGLVGGAAPETAAKLFEIGVSLGIGFQLKDDLLDVYGDPGKFGKQVGGDIIANKKTYLFLKALETAVPEVRSELRELFSTSPADPASKIERVIALYDSLNIRQITENLIKKYFDEAADSLSKLDVRIVQKNELLSFVSYLMNREK